MWNSGKWDKNVENAVDSNLKYRPSWGIAVALMMQSMQKNANTYSLDLLVYCEMQLQEHLQADYEMWIRSACIANDQFPSWPVADNSNTNKSNVA